MENKTLTKRRRKELLSRSLILLSDVERLLITVLGKPLKEIAQAKEAVYKVWVGDY